MIPYEYIITGLGALNVIEFVVILLFVSKFPAFVKLITAKRVVFEIDGDGQMVPVKARTHSGAMITKGGIYPYTKEDVIRCSGLTGILAHKASDSRAINPRLMPVFSLFKRLNVDSMEDIESLLKAPLVSKAEYEAMMKKETIKQNYEAIMNEEVAICQD